MTSDATSSMPEFIGKYRVEKILGKGAMGVVYLARDPTIDRPVALKTIVLPDGLDEQKIREFRARFLLEARAAGRLSHPSIVTVYEADDGRRSGIPYIAMEYVEGLPWNYKIRRGTKQDPTAALPLIREIASALAYAHQSGVVHRDIKPANIVQTPDGHVKLMDFGIAKVPTSELTREGQFLGTPAYMSPEQVMGKTVDGRSDLFSLGTVLYELLTCHKPFPGEEMTSVGFRICKEDPRPVEEYNPDIPVEVRDMIRHLLAKSPEDRYATAVELTQDIDAYMAGAGLPHAGTRAAPVPRDPNDATVVTEQPPGPISSQKKAPGPRPAKQTLSRTPHSGPSIKPVVLGLIAAAVFIAAVAATGVFFMLRGPADVSIQPPPIDEFHTEPVIPPDLTAQAESLSNEPVPVPKTQADRRPGRRRSRAVREVGKTESPGPREAVSAPGVAPAHKAATKIKPAEVSYVFSNKILRGEFQILIDGKPMVTKRIHRRFSFKDAVYSGTFKVQPGTHEVALRVKTEIQNISELHKEKKSFREGEDARLKIVMTRFNKEIHFEWGG